MQGIKIQKIFVLIKKVYYLCARNGHRIVEFIVKEQIEPNLFGKMNNTNKVMDRITTKGLQTFSPSKRNLVRLTFSLFIFGFYKTKIVYKCKVCRNFFHKMKKLQ
jgi:hypothetical protein